MAAVVLSIFSLAFMYITLYSTDKTVGVWLALLLRCGYASLRGNSIGTGGVWSEHLLMWDF
jgi:hypothetical protein